MARWLVCWLFSAAVVWPQARSDLFERAPPQIDQALRARITKFYQAHVDGKFRQADEVVAEDSKDIFFAADKTRCFSFEIVTIKYSENFTRANALVTCEADFVNLNQRMRVKMPRTTLWKVEAGEWWWYALPPTNEQVTPFGIMRPGPGETQAPAVKLPGVAEIQQQVQADKTAVELSSYQPAAAEVVVTNRMPGSIRLRVEHETLAGLEVKLDRQEVPAGESARVLLRMTPPDKTAKPTQIVKVHVEPTAQVIPIRVTFAVPPEIQKQIPK